MAVSLRTVATYARDMPRLRMVAAVSLLALLILPAAKV
jgi:hypothetical protein